MADPHIYTPYLEKVTVGGDALLGERVTLELDPRMTILVGRNGVGKSLVLEAIAESARMLVTGSIPNENIYISMTLRETSGVSFVYEFEAKRTEIEDEPDEDDESDADVSFGRGAHFPTRPVCRERCYSPESGAEHWSIRDGELNIQGHDPVQVQVGSGGLSLVLSTTSAISAKPDSSLNAALSFNAFFRGMTLIQAGLPREYREFPPFEAERHRGGRPTIVVTAARRRDHKLRWRAGGGNRLVALTAAIANFSRDTREELEDILGRLGVASRVEVLEYYPVQPNLFKEGNAPGPIAAVSVDDVNLGGLSDGTLRLLQIIVAAMGGRRLMIIEEPETGIHPGLLERLMQELSAYSLTTQFICSTHSPTVIDRAEASCLRFVTWDRPEKLAIQPLTQDQAVRVAQYLEDEGTLSDWIFSEEV